MRCRADAATAGGARLRRLPLKDPRLLGRARSSSFSWPPLPREFDVRTTLEAGMPAELTEKRLEIPRHLKARGVENNNNTF